MRRSYPKNENEETVLKTAGSLPLAIRLVPLRIALDEIHAQQTPPGFQLRFGFDAVGEKFKKMDEAGKKFGHGWRSVKSTIQGSIKNRVFPQMRDFFRHVFAAVVTFACPALTSNKITAGAGEGDRNMAWLNIFLTR